MAELTERMRAVMAAWVSDPDNAALKREFASLQRRYQRLFAEHKNRQRQNGAA